MVVQNGCKHYNLGHMIYDHFSRHPDRVLYIDAATDQSEIASSVIQRSTTVARCLRKLGLKPGDVLALGGRNHLDLRIPFMAGIFNGLPVAALDPLFKYEEIKSFLELAKPRIAFIQEENYEDISKASKALGLDTKIITFEDGEHSLKRFIQEYGGESDEKFELADFDGDEIPVFLIATSGTTGMPKLAVIHHENAIKVVRLFISMFSMLLGAIPPAVPRRWLNLSPAQWVSGCFYSFMMPLMGITILQTSKPGSVEHYVDVINKYKPLFSMWSPGTAMDILRSKKPCDLTCFKYLMLTGSKIYPDVLQELKERTRGVVVEGYGQTETLGMVMRGAPEGPPGNCGQDCQMTTLKLVDPDTLEEITKPHTPGELYVKGNGFSGYYNMPEETKKAFSEDGYYKTGDIMYRDDNNYYFFVEKAKMLIKYNNYAIHPTEIEAVIRTHPSVEDVAVSSLTHKAHGELPVACVVLAPGAKVEAKEIEDLVAEKLSEVKKLRGGVVFMDSLPKTSTGKIARGKLRDMVRKTTELNGNGTVH